MLWSIDSCQSRVSTDQYHLTVSCAQVSTHWGRVFFWSLHWQVTSFQMIAGSSIYIFKFIWNMLCLCHNGPTRKFSQFSKNTDGEDFFLPRSWVHQALRPIIFMLWLVKIWQVGSCGKFIQHLETCLFWQLKLTEFCVNLWFFHWMYKMKYSWYQESSVIHGYFVYWVFGWEMHRVSKLEIRFWMASFLFFTLLDA